MPWPALHTPRPGRAVVQALAGLMILAGAAAGQQDPGIALGSRPSNLLIATGLPDEFDAGQETPRGPLSPPPEPDAGPASLARSRYLLGDPLGLHGLDGERGLTFYSSFTTFEQAVVAGGVRQAGRWGGRFDLLAHLDSQELGLWSGGTLDLFAESRLGQSVDADSVAYSPPNLAMFFPVPDEQITAITGLMFTQAVTDRAGVFVGKLNALNGDRGRFRKYPLTSRFWNAAFNFNLALDRYPYSAPGAGLYFAPDRGPALSLLVLDSFNSPRTSGLERLGENGVFVYAEARQATRLAGLPGSQKVAGLYGTGRFADLSPASFLDLPPGAVGMPLQQGTWTVLWNAEQRLWVDPASDERGVGLYSQVGFGDGNPNPILGFLSVALCGNLPGDWREGDLVGLGFYQIWLGDAVKGLVPGMRDESGLELFYNLRLRPGCHLTPDLQWIRPGLAPVDTAVLLGVRLKLDF